MDGSGDGGVLSHVDAADLLPAMSASERGSVQQAWRRPEPVTADGVLAAVAVTRVRSYLRFVWFQAVGWPLFAGSMLLGPAGRVAVGAAVVGLGISAVAWWSVVRARRSLRRLAAAADVDRAHARAVELRRERHTAPR